MAVISHPGTNELEAVLATLRSMWERAVHCGGGTVPAILSRPLDEVVGKMYRNVNYLADVQAAVNALCEHATTKAAIQRNEGWCCSGYEPNSWPVYIRDQASVTSMASPSRLVLTQGDWFDDISALVTWLSTNVYTGTGCPDACFDQVSSIHPECLSVTGWDSLVWTAVIAETPDPEAAGYDDDYYTWDGSLQWVGADWWLESCFANTRIAYLATVASTYNIHGHLIANYWGQRNVVCEASKTPLIDGRKIDVYLTIEGTTYKKYTLTFETACAGVIVWEGCKEGGGNVAGTYTRTSGRSAAPATMTVASAECPAPSTCPCGTWPPTTWPCGGLVEEYVASNGTTSFFDGTPCYATAQGEAFGAVTELRLVGAVTCTATANSCEWEGPANSIERRDIMYDGDGNPSVFLDWRAVGAAKINLSGCAWAIESFRRPTGQTPAGEYIDGYDQGSLCSGDCTVRARLTVAEAAP